MDNDNKLVQKAADLYRSLRFSMKYRGLTILSAEAGNDAIAAAIAAGAPYMAARCGATEMRTVRSSVAAQKPPAMPNCARWSPTTTPTRGAPHWPESVCWWCTPLKQR